MSQTPIIVTGLDVGSKATRCVVSLLEEERLRILGFGEVPSQGWAKGRIVDQQAVSQCVHAAVREAEAMSQTTVEAVVAGFGGASVRGANTRWVHDLRRPKEIQQYDIVTAMEKARQVHLPEGQMVLQVLWQDFVVDDQSGFRDPRNMIASKLEANAHVVMASAQEHENLVGAINRAHLAVDETIYEGVASAYASVLPEERTEGVVVLDIGLHSTEMVCYLGDSTQLAMTLKVSGDNFSRDLARNYGIPFSAGAAVKEEFGSAMAEGTSPKSMVELPVPALGGNAAREASRLEINQILEWRARDLFVSVREELLRVGMARSIAGGVVLTGGGALLPGMCEIAEHVLQCHSHIGLTQGIRGWPEELNSPVWTTASGLSMYAARLRSKVDSRRQSFGVLGRMLGRQ